VYCLHHQDDVNRCYIPEGSNLHIRRREILKSHFFQKFGRLAAPQLTAKNTNQERKKEKQKEG
jgi:hypothetical protein